MVDLTIQPIVAEALDRVELLTQRDREFIDLLRSDKRRREVTSWRVALRQRLTELGLEREAQREIEYDAVGAPHLEGSQLHIGVSHSSTHTAVVVSECRCAVDIESLERDFERVNRRYVSSAESTLLEDRSLLLALLWAAKESLYKLSATRGLDLIEDLRVESIDPRQQIICGSIFGAEVMMSYDVTMGHVVVCTPSK